MGKHKIVDFSRGITDYIYKSGDSFSEQCDNLVVNRNNGIETRFGRKIFNETYPRIPSEARITKSFEFKGDVILKSVNQLYSFNSTTGFSEIQGEGSRSVFYNHGEEDYVDHDVINNQMIFTSNTLETRPLLVYKSTDYEATTLGLPDIPSTPVVTPAAGGSSVSYLYAFVYFRTYTSGGLTFEEFGRPEYLSVESAAAVEVDGSNPYAVSSIPVLSNAANTYFKTGTGSEDIKVRIYRTINNGSVFFYLGDSAGLVDNGTTTASDNIPDADLIFNNVLYTEGGIVENELPPTAKYVTVAKECAWYGNQTDAPNRVIQSKVLNPAACPSDFFVDVDDDITGLGTTRDFPIVFTRDKVFRIEGFIDNLGRGNVRTRVITDRVGCINNRTITQTRAGIYFAGSNGWFFTDGYSLTPISEQLEKRYPELLLTDLAEGRMSGTYLSDTRQVFFSCQSGADNDILYVFDEEYNAWTTMTGQTGFTPTSVGLYDSQLICADDEGYLYKFDNNTYSDIVRDNTVSASDWRTEAIIYNYKHVATSIGDLRLKKWWTKVNVQIDNKTGQHVNVGSFDERNFTRRVLKPIIVEGALPWGASGTAWGISGITWGGNEMVSRTRRFPAGKLRSRFKQLSLTNYRSILFDSEDSLGNATASNSTKYIDLDNTSNSWPSDIIGESIRFGDNTQEFEILERISNTRIRVYDPGNGLVSASNTWEIVGYKKSERMNLQAITYTYIPLSDRGSYYDSASEGGKES